MSKIKRRAPQLGDLIMETVRRVDGHSTEYLGVIYDISSRHLAIAGSAFIHWVDKVPYSYNNIYGYSVVSIQNEYDRFSIVSEST